MAKVDIIDTTFRDAHQSLIATRLTTDDMLKIAETMDRIGFYSMEVWGGATFDVCIRYLKEDPWERLRLLREHIRKTKLQMLLRGQNVVGYKHYPDDVVEKFVELAHKNGIDIFRIFDALNDVRNMEVAIRKAKEVGAEVQGAIAYTTGKVFTLEYYMKKVEELLKLDVDVITIKDMAGLLTPWKIYELVSEIKETYGIPVNVHTHSTTGMAVAVYLKGVEAGADYIDTAISPLAFGTAQPGIQTIWHALPEAVGSHLDRELIHRVSRYLKKLLEEKYWGLLHKETLIVNPYVLKYQVPGGMFSNLIAQLKEMNALDRLDEVLEEIPRVREDLGWPPLVTPTSQIVGTQAVLNVLFGRYKQITQQVKDYIRGLYGRPPAEINPELKRLVLGDEEPIKERPGSLLKPQLEECRRKLEELGYLHKEEDVLTYCLFPEVALEFFRARAEGRVKVELPKTASKVKVYVNGVEFEVGIEGVDLSALKYLSRVQGITPAQTGSPEPVQVSAPAPAPVSVPAPASTPAPASASPNTVTAPMPGKILRVLVKEGQEVKAGQGLLVLEAMKMENEIPAPKDGVVKKIYVKEGDAVNTGDPLIELG
ncbi:pyruvate/oxaloacetate carboxyltransferase [Thermococcus gammatolerans]|uniref:Pyruvate carboxylase subunit B (PycB) n=1 Tax=Thermococcus gammatolerans (strain DSM 15229 / JCM 11827 / EJ3) TaxID=593117 RepID=C5A1I6_THEGJ|nr:pyruvate/oxaloacetate carboxyltransferase [Thermococcus gammatolerans]ACS34255.1 Pyruvate carboxylase subunit B (pycB) [Thermococcus gammatolerans EJ3]